MYLVRVHGKHYYVDSKQNNCFQKMYANYTHGALQVVLDAEGCHDEVNVKTHTHKPNDIQIRGGGKKGRKK